VLRYVEYHLVEHCNLSCQRCGHFSPLAKPAFSDPEDFARDLGQLAKHFSTIERIRLLGGEPLLHPTPEAFIEGAHAISPNSDLRIVTNGTLLKSMRNSFWEACRRADLTLDFSMYPIMEKARTQLEELCARERVKINVNRYTTFLAGINPVGDSDPVKSMAYCRKQFYCPFLKNSRLYVCGFPATLHYFNDKFGQAIPDDPGIDIFDPTLDGHRILQLLETPVETCRFCSCLYEEHPWKSVRGREAAEDYYVSQVTRDRVASNGGLQASIVAAGRASSSQVLLKADLPG
jgi:hypothetical protein